MAKQRNEDVVPSMDIEMIKEIWPNFLIIGASHSGTTSLYNYLKSHPDIFMSSTKEPGFFAFDFAAGQEPELKQVDMYNLE